MGLKRIVFDSPITDRMHHQNSKLYVEIIGRKKERKAYLMDEKKSVLELRYFVSSEKQREIYGRAEALIRKCHKKEGSLPSDFLGKLFS